MQPSSTLCRAREAHHHALARAATLDNVRLVASAAAAAWAKEGTAAGLREARKERAQAAVQLPLEPPPVAYRELSENPDRGHADAGFPRTA
jgi:hypothetical protein